MAQQLIFTSTPQGLEPGRSGYCTVARHKDLRHRLVRELERLSVYDFGQQTGSSRSDICIFRKVPLGSEEFYVLTKICDAGLDYTNRTNYLAHHLVLDGFEIATSPSPAEIFLNWDGWLRTWPDGPRYFGEEEVVTFAGCKSTGLVPCQSWLQVTNDPGNAASLVSPDLIKPIVVESKEGNANTLLTLFAESSALFKISLDAWDFSFTTFLQGNDDAKSFAWIGIQGQPAGERIKQGGIRNYLDLRNWASTEIADPLDPNLQDLARKGPVKAAAKKKSATITKAPFSDQELQRAKAAAPVQGAAAPAGSTMVAQEASISKNKKKRPWLLQLAVISTALCLLAVLVWGLTSGIGDWFRENQIASPDSGNPSVSPDPDKGKQPTPKQVLSVTPNSPVEFGRTEYLKLAKKPRSRDLVELDVGGGEVETVRLSERQQEIMGQDLPKMQEGDELEVVLQKDADSKPIFKSIEKARDPEYRGRPWAIDLSDKSAVSISDDEKTLFFRSGEQNYPLSLRLLSSSERTKMLKLYELVQAGSSVEFMPRIQDERIVYYDPVTLPSDPQANPDPPKPKVPSGTPRTLSAAKGREFFDLHPNQRRILLMVDDKSRERLPYVFSEDERDRIMELAAFLEKGEQEVDIDVKVDGDQITFLAFDLPASLSSHPDPGSDELDPQNLVPDRVVVLWVPGSPLGGEWTLELKGNYSYKHSLLPDFLADQLEAGLKSVDGPRLWMADFAPGMLLDGKFSEDNVLEKFSFERDRLGGSKIITFSIKSADPEQSNYSFDLKLTRGETLDLRVDTDHARNSAQRGKLLRIPSFRKDGKCTDLFILSNKHNKLDKLNLIGSKFSISSQGSIRLGLSQSSKFTFLFPELHKEFRFGIGVKNQNLDGGILVLHKTPQAMDYFSSEFKSPPKALLVLSNDNPMGGKLLPGVSYLNEAVTQLQGLKLQYDEEIVKRAKDFPPKVVQDNLRDYLGRVSKISFTAYDEGTPLGKFMFQSMMAFLRNHFDVWDEVRFLNMRGRLGLFESDSLPTQPKLHLQFLEQVSKEVENYLLTSMSDFGYSVKQGTSDTKLLVEYLNFLLEIEKSMGVKDEGFLKGIQGIRDRIASPSPDELFGKLNKEIQSLADPALSNTLKVSFDAYQNKQITFLPPAELTLGNLSKSCNLFSSIDLLKKYKAEISTVSGFERGRDMSSKKIEEFSNRSRSLTKSSNNQANQHEDRKKMVPNIQWTLAVYKKDAQGDFVKESDFLRLSPPEFE